MTLTDVIYKITYFQQNNESIKAVEIAIQHSKQHTNTKGLIIFTDSMLKNDTLYLKTLYTEATYEWIPFNDPYLLNFPHQFYAFFTCRGFYIEHVTSNDLPAYYDTVYFEEQDTDNESEWLIKSIRNIVFHEPEENKEIAAIMLLCDWEVDKNKGLWIEKPNNNSEISWIALHNLNNYYVLEQYLKYRCLTISGTTKHCNNLTQAIETDMETYLNLQI